jgi:hypothetical protein
MIIVSMYPSYGINRIGGPKRDLMGLASVRSYFASFPITEINVMLRLNFLMFLYGCNLHYLAPSSSSSTVTTTLRCAGLTGVIKYLSAPYLDRSFMEFIFHNINEAPDDVPAYDEEDDCYELLDD